MKVKAKHWINANGDWHKCGEIFEVNTLAGIEDAVEVIAEEPKVVELEQQEIPAEEPKQTKTTGTRRTRKSNA